MTLRFDAIFTGTAQAGPSLAARLSESGMKVAVIERKLFGGTCVNTGCIPTKTLVASAYAAHLARRAAEYGVGIAGTVGEKDAVGPLRQDRGCRGLRRDHRHLHAVGHEHPQDVLLDPVVDRYDPRESPEPVSVPGGGEGSGCDVPVSDLPPRFPG